MRRIGRPRPVVLRFPAPLLEEIDERIPKRSSWSGAEFRTDYLLRLIAAALGVDVRTAKKLSARDLKDRRTDAGIQ